MLSKLSKTHSTVRFDILSRKNVDLFFCQAKNHYYVPPSSEEKNKNKVTIPLSFNFILESKKMSPTNLTVDVTFVLSAQNVGYTSENKKTEIALDSVDFSEKKSNFVLDVDEPSYKALQAGSVFKKDNEKDKNISCSSKENIFHQGV